MDLLRTERVRRVLVVSVVATMAAVTVSWVIFFARGDPFRPDYSVLWVASREAWRDPVRIYDAVFMTEAQSWLATPVHGLRPWAYPPSTLVALAPFTWLPFWTSYLAWIAVGLYAFVVAARNYVRGWWLLIVALSPPVFVAAVSGQTSLLVAALGLTAISHKKSRPFVAGVALGVASAIKPQAMLAAPFLLCRNGLAGFAAGGVAMLALVSVLGVSPWLAWISALPEFAATARALGVVSITPSGLAQWAGLPVAPVWLAGAACGVALALHCRGRSAETQALGLFGGSLLISPYAVIYDASGLMVPAAAAMAALWHSSLPDKAISQRGKATVGTVYPLSEA